MSGNDPFEAMPDVLSERTAARGIDRQSKPALMCSIRRKNGTFMGFSYALLQRIDCDPYKSIRLHFPDYTLVLNGQRLEELYDQLVRHVRTEIIEFDELHAAAFQRDSVVNLVEFSQPENPGLG